MGGPSARAFRLHLRDNLRTFGTSKRIWRTMFGPLAHNLVRVRRSRSRTILRGASTGREAIRRYSQRRRSNPSRFFGDDFAIFPYIDRRAVHARGLARHFGGAAQRAAHRGGEFFAGSGSGGSFHGDLSNNLGVLPELSYPLQASAKSHSRGSEADGSNRSSRSKRSNR